MKVVNVKTCTTPYQYIGRGSKWGNPFIIPRDGNRNQVCLKYRDYLLSNQELLDSLPELVADGRDLGCYCAPQLCHGNILLLELKKRGMI